MRDVREVYEMVTKQKPPEPGALERQQKRQVRAARGKKYGAFAVAATIGLIAIVLILATRSGPDTSAPADEPSTVYPVDANAMQAASGFVDAFGAFDAEGATSYLASDLSPGSDFTPKSLPRLTSLLEAQGYTQIPGPCGVADVTAFGTSVHCPFDFDGIRSDEIGLGPYHGSYWDFTVRDGEITEALLYFDTSKFSPQVWEPFAEWVSATYPDDVAVMYQDETQSDWRFTDESIRLWGQHSREYVKHVQSASGA